MTPDPTAAELDEWERSLHLTGIVTRGVIILRLLKALRACRLQCEAHRRCTRDAMATADRMEEQSKAKAVVIEALECVLPMAKGYAYEHRVGRNRAIVDEAESVLAAFNKETSDD